MIPKHLYSWATKHIDPHFLSIDLIRSNRRHAVVWVDTQDCCGLAWMDFEMAEDPRAVNRAWRQVIEFQAKRHPRKQPWFVAWESSDHSFSNETRRWPK